MNKKSLSETDIRSKFISPTIFGTNGAGWDLMTQVDRLDAPFAAPMGRNLALLSSIVMNDRFRAMGDKDFVGKTALIYEALFEFNMAVGEDTLNTGAVLGRGSMPTFMGMKESDAKARIERADKMIHELQGLLRGMADAADSQRSKIEIQFAGKL